MEIANIIILIGSLITACAVIIGAVKKVFSKAIEPVHSKIDKMDERQCKNVIIDFLNDVEQGIEKDEVQYKFIHDTYDHYTNDLHLNSYVHDKWERVMNNKNNNER